MSTYNDYDDDTVTLTLDDGKEVECSIVAIYPAGDNEYIALLPLGGEVGRERLGRVQSG